MPGANARVALARGLAKQVELDERLGELALQRRQKPHLALDVGVGVDDPGTRAELG